MNRAPAFSVIIPVFNKWELTEQCLRSLREHSGEYVYEVIVADNGSTDATATELPGLGEALFKDRFRLLRFEENRNFGPACNAGALEASAPLLFFLNNDTILTPGWAPPLLAALEADPGLGGVGPLLLYEDDTVQHLGVAFAVFKIAHLYHHFPEAHPLVGRHRRFRAITAAALMMPRALFWEHSGFYEEYRNGFEDVDLCLRIAATGKSFTCIPESRIYHLESRTPGRKTSEQHNMLLLLRRFDHSLLVDWHIHGLADGLVPFLNDFFDVGLMLSEDEERQIARQTRWQDPAHLRECIRLNPLWRMGREALAKSSEDAGDFAEALELRTALAIQMASEESFRVLLRCATLARNEKARIFADQASMTLRQYRSDQEEAERFTERGLMLAERAGDALLAGMYKEKLAGLFPQSRLLA